MNLIKKIGNFVWSKTFLFNLLALALVYIIMFFSLRSCLDSSTHHGQKIEVPNLIGKNSNNVKRLLAGTDLNYVILDSIYDPTKTEGTILEQDPRPTDSSNLFVKEGRTIKLRVSKRNMSVEMPDLIDKSQRFAEGMLRNRQFRYTIKYVPSVESNGAVIEQNYRGKPIASGVRIPVGAKINLVIGRNEEGIPLPLPNLYGLTIDDAKKRVRTMQNIDFFVGRCDGCATKSDSLTARVIAQSPEYFEEAKVAAGGSITVTATTNFTGEIPE